MKDVIKNTGESSIFLPITQNFINKKAPHERCFSYDIDIIFIYLKFSIALLIASICGLMLDAFCGFCLRSSIFLFRPSFSI
ncbi:hypothetical protein M2254_002965 [Chryseobacterium sp. BIGb0186]|nr:hypothetical protein [Chryseobacterium sp. BIGb0186]